MREDTHRKGKRLKVSGSILEQGNTYQSLSGSISEQGNMLRNTSERKSEQQQVDFQDGCQYKIRI